MYNRASKISIMKQKPPPGTNSESKHELLRFVYIPKTLFMYQV